MDTLTDLATKARHSGDRAELVRYLRARREARTAKRLGFSGRAEKGHELDANAEDLSDIVAIVCRHEAPLLEHIGDPERPSDSTCYEWTDSTGIGRNMTTIFKASVEAYQPSGFDLADEVDYQKQERLRELLRDLENCVVNGSGAMRPGLGLLELIDTVDLGGNPLTTDAVNAAIDKDEAVDTIVVGGRQCRRLREIGAVKDEDEFRTYTAGHRPVRIVLCRWVPPDTVLVLAASLVSVVPLRGRSFHFTTQGRTDLAVSGTVLGEYALAVRERSPHTALRGLST